MTRIAILDDYQNVALELADWSPVTEKATVTVFNALQPDARSLFRSSEPRRIMEFVTGRQALNGVAALPMAGTHGLR
jgi:hypothetical protein